MGIKRGFEAVESKKADITEDEAALYDRQIRLWGLESQKRLRDAKILLVGLNGLGAEVAKNIVLAGVKSITLFDEKNFGPEDRSSQFLLCETDYGTNKAEGSQSKVQQLNPNVEVISISESLNEKTDNYFTQFDVVCLSDCSPEALLRLNKVCREHNIKFFCGSTWGLHGYCFVDVGTYTFITPPDKTGKSEDEPQPKVRLAKVQANYSSLERALSFKSGKAGQGLHKKMSKIFFLVHILLKFHETHNRYPVPEHRTEDTESLKALRTSVMEKLGFDETKIKDEDLSNVFGEMSPVCAIVGGVLSQEIIKAVCASDLPIQNFFLFDGDTNLGVVESIG